MATVPGRQTRTFSGPEGEPVIRAAFTCVSPVSALVGNGSSDAAWFGYAPNTGVAFSPEPQRCLPDARRRVLVAAVLAVAGGAVLVAGGRRAKQLRVLREEGT